MIDPHGDEQERDELPNWYIRKRVAWMEAHWAQGHTIEKRMGHDACSCGERFDGLTTGADSAGSGAPRTVDGEARDQSQSPMPNTQSASSAAPLLSVTDADADDPFGSFKAANESRSYREINALKREIVRLRKELDATDPALRSLSEKWRKEGARIDAFHATMGTGYHACAADLDAVLLARGGQENETDHGKDHARVDRQG